MDIHIHIDDKLVGGVRRILGGKRGAVLAGLAVLATAGAVFAVTGTPAFTFKAGDPILSSQVNQNFQELYAAVSALQAAKGCPSGMVPVGDVCVDKYEGSVWSRKDAKPVDCAALQVAVDGGTWAGEYSRWGQDSDDYPVSFPDSGNFTSKLYACSTKGVVPSRFLTWFQAQQACTASGKHLITNGEWQAAVAGTVDPGASDGANGSANTKSGVTRQTGKCTGTCSSNWGVDDGIGNLFEWVDLWGQAGKLPASVEGALKTPWPVGYGDGKDGSSNLNGSATVGLGAMTDNMPAAMQRGGNWDSGPNAGTFALDLYSGPSYSNQSNGFRCAARGPL